MGRRLARARVVLLAWGRCSRRCSVRDVAGWRGGRAGRTDVKMIGAAVVSLALLLAGSSLASGSTSAEEERARQVAESWLRSLAGGETALTASLSDVPPSSLP